MSWHLQLWLYWKYVCSCLLLWYCWHKNPYLRYVTCLLTYCWTFVILLIVYVSLICTSISTFSACLYTPASPTLSCSLDMTFVIKYHVKFVELIAWYSCESRLTRCSMRQHTSPPVSPPGDLDQTGRPTGATTLWTWKNMCRLWFWPVCPIIYENMTSSTKPDVHNVLHCRQTMT